MTSADLTLIERLRKENLEQFFTLVRMHLSFVVDINTDDVDCSTDKPKQFRWNFHKKTKNSSSNSSQNNTNITKNNVEVSSITEDGILRVNELIDFLSKPDNVTQEGIFRRTGSLSRQQELKNLLLTGTNLGLDEGKFSVHDCASVLKGFLAELPQPLLMDQYYQTYCTLAGTPIQIQRTGKVAGSRSFGDSIKRHIFNKGLLNKTPKKGSGSNINVIEEKSAKGKLRFTDDNKVDVSHKNIVLKNLAHKIASSESLDDDYDSDASNESTLSEGALNRSRKLSPKFVSEPNLSALDTNDETPKKKRGNRLFRSKIVTTQTLNKKYQKRNGVIRGTPTCVSCFDDQDTGSEHESYQETSEDKSPMDTPTKILQDDMKHYLTSTPGISDAVLFDEDFSTPYTINFRRASMSPITKSTQKLSKAMQESIMTPRSRKPLIITSEQRDMADTTVQKDETIKSDVIYQSMSPKNDSDFVSSDDDDVTRSTFSCERSRSRSSQSASTSLPRTNQLDARSINSIGDGSPVRPESTRFVLSRERPNLVDDLNTTLCGSDDGLPKFAISCETNEPTKCLSEPFREYLLSRSVLTATPIDLSILNKSNETDDKISDSLLYCLDGNVPSDLTLSISNLAVDKESSLRSPLKSICVNIDKSPNRKRLADDIGCIEESTSETKKLMVAKENIKEVFEIRETEL
ncbi:hypothetical protein HF086_007467 [Spodoptera exigua]|uniref:Rho-GAP domain-containing protein n=1 Tax=Spodoptera exigua TaxID=7107 RepID=A0A922MLY3_SPOEX|nr:hypothetical protein HF086_007467 [Spodoptera exigua]